MSSAILGGRQGDLNSSVSGGNDAEYSMITTGPRDSAGDEIGPLDEIEAPGKIAGSMTPLCAMNMTQPMMPLAR